MVEALPDLVYPSHFHDCLMSPRFSFARSKTLAIIRSFLFRNRSVKQSIANIAMLRKVVNVRHVIQHSAASKKLRKTSDNRCRNTQTQMKSGHPPINWIVLHSLNCFQFPWWLTFVKKSHNVGRFNWTIWRAPLHHQWWKNWRLWFMVDSFWGVQLRPRL